jgi:hypothetical protein
MVLDPVLEEAIFPTSVRHDGDETPTVGGDVAHRVFRAEFGVGDIQEVTAAEHRDEAVPGRHVGHVVVGVAVCDPQRDGHRAVGRDGEVVDELAQVWTKVLVMAERHDRHVLAAPDGGLGLLVGGAGHGDGRRIVVQF